ncbi:hypothetical protein [Candidatus Uabimicrobium amorphum]|uniref:Uncharacterized protein n=1 Tax=Uabimicrobium amorphum TaxID=2596890 RepID=A0A5S9F5D8_UABAM|nr:hypothetical protein [Candidatus Uabimicrobium amorphum]BBM86043.1 hypothetical protein UABAM_04429 [Candidatus Uabimicrobium amorphum]
MRNVWIGSMWVIFCCLPICAMIIRRQPYKGLLGIAFVAAIIPVMIVVYNFLNDEKNHNSRVARMIRITLGIYAVFIMASNAFLVCKGIYLYFQEASTREVFLHLMSIFGVMIGLIMLQMTRLGYKKKKLSHKLRIVPKINFILGAIIFVVAAGFFVDQIINNIVPSFSICIITCVTCLIGTVFILRGGIAICFAGKVHHFWPTMTLLTGITLPILFGFMITTVFLGHSMSEEEFEVVIFVAGAVILFVAAFAMVLSVALFRGAYLEAHSSESWIEFAGIDIKNNPNKISERDSSAMMFNCIVLVVVIITSSYYTTKHTLYRKHYQKRDADRLKFEQYTDFAQKLSQQTGNAFQQTFHNIKNFPEMEQFAKIHKIYKYDGAALAYFYWLKEKKSKKKSNMIMGVEVTMLREVNTQAASKDDAKRLIVYQILRHFLGYDLIYRTFLFNSKDPNPEIAKLIKETVEKHEENLHIFQKHIRDDYKKRK